MTESTLEGSMVLLLPDRLDPNKQRSVNAETVLNSARPDPADAEANGTLPSSAIALPAKARSRPKKAPELSSVERRNWLVHLHYVRGEFNECLKLTKELLAETHGMCEYANYVQALILRHQGNIHESLELFQLCNVLNPNSVQNLKQMARSLQLLGRHSRAVEAYKQAESKMEKADWEIHYNLGVCYHRLGQLDVAKEQLQSALQLHRHHATFEALARVYLQQGDVSAAVSTYRAAIEQFPENSDLHCNLGKLLLQTGRVQQAFEQLGAALTFQPDHSATLLAVGAMMQSHQDFDVALSKYRVAAQSIPESAALWNNIAMCFFGKKKYVAAISCLKRANYLAPFEWRVLYNLGLVHLTMQQTTSAFHFLSAAVNLKPSKGQIFMLLAVTLSQLDDESNARLAYQQAVTLETKDPSVCLNYAIFLLRQGDKQEALDMYLLFEARAVKIRQNVELDSQILDAGRRLAQELGQDHSLLGQKPSKPKHDVPDQDKQEETNDPNMQRDSVVPEGFPSRGAPEVPGLLALPPRTDVDQEEEARDPDADEENDRDDMPNEEVEEEKVQQEVEEEGELPAEEHVAQEAEVIVNNEGGDDDGQVAQEPKVITTNYEDDDDAVEDDDGGQVAKEPKVTSRNYEEEEDDDIEDDDGGPSI